MELDLGQMLAFCLVMLENAIADPGLSQGAGLAIGEAEATLEIVSEKIDQELSDGQAAQVITEIGQATADMPGADQEEAVAFCADMAGEL